MGDDFDLFPKRENLDPFSFGKKEKSSESGKEGSSEELFGEEEQPPKSLPELPVDLPPDTSETSPLPDLPGSTAAPPPAQGAEKSASEYLDGILSEGPITEGKTFDEPVLEQQELEDDGGKGSTRKSPSPFIVVGGALVIIIGILYGALTYLKKDKPLVPDVSTPPVSVTIPQPPEEPAPVQEPAPETEPAAEQELATEQEPAPVPESEAPQQDIQTETLPSEEASGSGEIRETQTDTPGKTSPEADAVAGQPDKTPEPAAVTATEANRYSVQVGAFILKSSVAELEKKLRGMGYEPFLKKGSTTAMMNMLTVGPFDRIDEARTALSRLREAGVDSNMRRRDDGSAIINAGSYLLEENADSIMRKIRSLGYPVVLDLREATLPMTFVRVGSYSGIKDATSAKEELKGKGLEGIIVKMQ